MSKVIVTKSCITSVERTKQKVSLEIFITSKKKETSSWTRSNKFYFEIISTGIATMFYGLNISKLVLYLEDSRGPSNE